MREVNNLKRIGDEFSKPDAGTLSIATTHTQARYFLPEPIAQLRKRFPKVNISLHQGAPKQVAQMVCDEIADIGIATEALDEVGELVTLPCYEWQHAVVMPAQHPLAQVERISLEDLALQPLARDAGDEQRSAGLPVMNIRTPAIESRLPAVGTTIFTVMSALAQEHGAVNLGQGFPDFDCDPRLVAAVDDAMRRGLNQYPP